MKDALLYIISTLFGMAGVFYAGFQSGALHESMKILRKRIDEAERAATPIQRKHEKEGEDGSRNRH